MLPFKNSEGTPFLWLTLLVNYLRSIDNFPRHSPWYSHANGPYSSLGFCPLSSCVTFFFLIVFFLLILCSVLFLCLSFSLPSLFLFLDKRTKRRNKKKQGKRGYCDGPNTIPLTQAERKKERKQASKKEGEELREGRCVERITLEFGPASRQRTKRRNTKKKERKKKKGCPGTTF